MSQSDGAYVDVCRVCRCEASTSRPLYYPCLCTGSIKYIHQDCLLKWLEYSKRPTCELCNHRFTFAPIYASGTPRFLPPYVLVMGVLRYLRRSLLHWLHLVMVLIAWGLIVPLTACRIYRGLFTGSISSLLTLPLHMLSTHNVWQDCLQGMTIVLLVLAAFLGYISLREQLAQGGTPTWLERVATPTAERNGDVNRRGFADLFNVFAGAREAAGTHDEAEVAAAVANNDLTPGDSCHEEATTSTHLFNTVTPDRLGTDNGLRNVSPAAPQTDESLPVQPQVYQWRADDLGQEEGANNEAEPDPDGAEAGLLGEAMNWAHLLGLDGSMVFLEHVLWMIALNTLFIVIFAFCPYYLGQFTVIGFKLDELVSQTHMEGPCITIVGYLIIAGALMLLYHLFNYMGMPRFCYYFGLCYLYLKVALVSLLEVGIFPILCGFWIDACTLSVFNASLASRISVFHYAPIAFTFIHWSVGMLYIFYMASLLLLVRSVVRPGLLSFLYHFNDPDYNPVQDMIMQPLPVYTQRLIATFSIWGIVTIFVLWIPIETMRRILPGLLPYQITIAHENPLDYSVEIILLQVVLPFLLDVQAKATVRQALRLSCVCFGRLLGIQSFLTGDVPFEENDLIVNEEGEHVLYHAPPPKQQTSTPMETSSSAHNPVPSTSTDPPPVHREAPNHNNDFADDDSDAYNRFVPYKRPAWFCLRILALSLLILLSLMLCSCILLIVPVSLGRLAFSLIIIRDGPKHDAVALVTGVTVLGLILRAASYLPALFRVIQRTFSLVLARMTNLFSWSQRPWHVLRIWTRTGTCEIPIPRPALPPPRASNGRPTISLEHDLARTEWLAHILTSIRMVVNLIQLVIFSLVFLIVLPVCFGLLINLIFIAPFQVGPNKSLVIGFWEHWIFGIMHFKVAILLTLAGPSWCLRHRLELIQTELVQHRYNAHGRRLLSAVAPMIAIVTSCLTVPYVLSHHLQPFLGIETGYVLRYIYPVLFAFFVLLVAIIWQLNQLQRLYVTIKDDTYLIGRRLVNFKSRHTRQRSMMSISQQEPATST